MADRASARAEGGFTLLETMIAFAILSLVLGTAYAGFSAAGRGTDRAEEALAALELAKSTLARLDADLPLSPGTRVVAEAPWRIETRARPMPGREVAGIAAVEVTVAVGRPGASASVTLTTARLVATEVSR